jgi:hypothetical protein
MAYLKDLPHFRCYHCQGKATVELFNHRNATLGAYCSRCGNKALGELQRKERQPAPPEGE